MSAALTEAQSIVVVAGAGTGKTHALVNDYIFTLLGLDGSGRVRSPHRVLAITFTDKAAAEMRRRVVMRLADLVRDPAGDVDIAARCEELRGSDGEGEVPAAEVLKRMQTQLAGAPIQTFHAFAASLLRDHALNAGVDPGFDQLAEAEEQLLLSETAEAVILDRLAEGDRDVAELTARFSLRRMGGGGGLTGSLCSLYSALAERGVAPSALQAACGPEAAAELVGARRVALYEEMSKLLIMLEDPATDAYARERRETLKVAFERLREALERPHSEQAEIAVAAAYKRLQREDGGWGRGPVGMQRVNTFLTLNDLGAALCDQAASTFAPAVRALLVDLDERVALEKDARGALGFGDLLLRARDLLRDHPSLRARVKARFDRVLVDEYQDTSPVQEDLVALLAEEPTRGDPVHPDERAMDVLRLGRGRLFVVGDPKQSIYGFRGADARLFSHTLDVVTEGNGSCGATGVRRTLNRSWRSRPPVVDLINTIASATLGAEGDDALFDEADRLRAVREGEGVAGALLVPEQRGEIDLEEAEPWLIARKVRELLDDQHPVTVDGEEVACRPRDITVLVRRIKAAASISRALAHVGVPAHITGGEGFFSRPEVMDLIAGLRLIVEPADDLAAVSVLRSPLVGLTDDELVRLHEAISGSAEKGRRTPLGWQVAVDVAEDAGLDERSADRLVRIDALLRALRERLPHERLPVVLDALMDGTAFVLSLGVEPDADDRLANVEKLRVLCEGRPGDAVATIGRLWTYLDAPPREGVATSVGPEVDAVRLMTVHQAKGLEFPIVFLADLGSTLLGHWQELLWEPERGLAVSHRGRPITACEPLWSHRVQPVLRQVRAVREQSDQAELMRLLYVALTRARDWVYLVGEERSSGKPSLRRLVERARTTHRQQMEALLPVERYPADAPPARPLPVREAEQLPQAKTLPAPISPIRVGPSALIGEHQHAADDDEEAPDVVEERRRRGRLVHEVIAAAGQEADAGLLADTGQARWLVEACLRAAGEDPASTRFGDMVKRCTATLCGPIRHLLATGYSLSFEEALRFEITGAERPLVVVGTADLVARSDDETLVVDFKSSRGAAQAESTWLQLAGYAAALSARGEGPIRMAAWVVGEQARDEDSRAFDAEVEQELLQRVHAVALGDLAERDEAATVPA
jgi:ATP-dependent helicase/nuclease subunit A